MESRFLVHMGKEEFKIFLKEVLREIFDEEKRAGMDADRLLNTRDAARLLDIAVATLYEKTAERSIPHYRHGKKILFKKSELFAWVESQKVATAEEIKKNASRYDTTR
jgi:excisionase family DNA binding protein